MSSLPGPRGVQILPIELLIKVFHYCDDFDPGTSRRSYLDWIAVLHTCRHWYHAGVQCSSLWQTICFIRRRDWVREVVKRSGGMPLTLAILQYDDFEPARILLDELGADRVRELDVSLALPSDEAYREFVRATRSLNIAALTHLERLNIRVTETFYWSGGGYLFLIHFFPCAPPALAYLDVTADCAISGIPDVPTLKSLSIQNWTGSSVHTEATIDVEGTLDALREMPLLQHFSMAGMLPLLDEETDTTTIEKVDLPALRSLSLRGRAGEYSSLCDFLSVPTRAQVTLEYELDDYDMVEGIVSSVSQLFSRALPGGRTEHRDLRSLAISDMGHGFAIHASPSPMGTDPTPSEDFHFTCSLYGSLLRSHDDAFLDGFRALFESLPCSGVSAVSVVGPASNRHILPVHATETLFPCASFTRA